MIGKGRDSYHGSKPITNKNPRKFPIDPFLATGLAQSPGVPAYELGSFVDYSSASHAGTTYSMFEVVKPGRFTFAPTSCARNVVIRPGYADQSAKKNTPDTLEPIPGEGRINTFFGGLTNKYQMGDALHQNYWIQYVLLHRDDNDASWNTTQCPISARYDVVVMPSVDEIDTYLPHAGFKRTGPCTEDFYCGSQVN